jgi:hypothetical protein
MRFRPQLDALEDRWLPSTLTVTNNLDSGPGSLRAEIAAAKPRDAIAFAQSLDGQTIKLTSGELDITKNLTIQGPGAGQLTVSGGGWTRVFEVAKGSNVSLSNLTISQGYASAGDGGGIYIDYRGTLTVSGCILSGNTAYRGGGIFNYGGGTVTISNSTLSGNSAGDPASAGEGGAIYNNGNNGGTETISGCTLSSNTAYQGGGIFNGGAAPLTVSGCTVSGNTAYYEGGGVYNAGALTVSNSVFSSNNPDAIYNVGSLTVSGNVFSGNHIYNYGSYTDGGGNTFN